MSAQIKVGKGYSGKAMVVFMPGEMTEQLGEYVQFEDFLPTDAVFLVIKPDAQKTDVGAMPVWKAGDSWAACVPTSISDQWKPFRRTTLVGKKVKNAFVFPKPSLLKSPIKRSIYKDQPPVQSVSVPSEFDRLTAQFVLEANQLADKGLVKFKIVKGKLVVEVTSPRVYR